MKIKDVMQTSFLSVTEDTPIKEVARIIFSTSISSIAVVKGAKLVGVIAEVDVISHMYPTLQSLVEGEGQKHNQEEKKLQDIVNIPVSQVMVKDVKTVFPETSLIDAQGLMIANHFRMVPVVDKDKKLLGVITHGDIFRQIIKKRSAKNGARALCGFYR